jgi:hypothetical protein
MPRPPKTRLSRPARGFEAPSGRCSICSPAARTNVLELRADIQEWSAWQAAARKMLEAANGGDISAASLQLELALFTSGKLKL